MAPEAPVPFLQIADDGISRRVFLVGAYALKVPRCRYGWRYFLQGLLANMQEHTFGTAGYSALCPVIGALPGGWLLIMRRARPLTDAEWAAFNVTTFRSTEEMGELAEPKQDSFGVFRGRVVAVDYGN